MIPMLSYDVWQLIWIECFENNKSGGETDVIVNVTHRSLNAIKDKNSCKDKCQDEGFCDAFVFTRHDSTESATCSLNTFGSSDVIRNDTGKVFGFKYCEGIMVHYTMS